MRPRSSCTTVMGREGKELLMIQNTPPHQWSMVVVESLESWCGHVWLPLELVPLYYWWCNCWQKQQDEFWSVSSNFICSYWPNAAKLIGRRFTVQMDNDTKHTAKTTKECFKSNKWNVMQWPSQSPDLNPTEHAFHLLKTKLKGKCPKNKQELQSVAAEAWQSVTRDETQRLVMSVPSRLQPVVDCRRFATKY